MNRVMAIRVRKRWTSVCSENILGYRRCRLLWTIVTAMSTQKGIRIRGCHSTGDTKPMNVSSGNTLGILADEDARGSGMGKTRKKVIPGWTGRCFEDFEVGDVYRSRFGRTVTEADNQLFTHLTMNTNPLHFDEEYARNTRWGKILVNSTFTLALVVGMSVPDVSEKAMANLGWSDIRLPNPVFVGDTLYCETEVLATRESKSFPEAGIVKVRTRGVNQAGRVVIDLTRSVMIYKNAHAPSGVTFPEIREEKDG